MDYRSMQGLVCLAIPRLSDTPWKGRWRNENQPLTLSKILFLLVTLSFFNNIGGAVILITAPLL